jgi:hypothetical protein
MVRGGIHFLLYAFKSPTVALAYFCDHKQGRWQGCFLWAVSPVARWMARTGPAWLAKLMTCIQLMRFQQMPCSWFCAKTLYLQPHTGSSKGSGGFVDTVGYVVLVRFRKAKEFSEGRHQQHPSFLLSTLPCQPIILSLLALWGRPTCPGPGRPELWCPLGSKDSRLSEWKSPPWNPFSSWNHQEIKS